MEYGMAGSCSFRHCWPSTWQCLLRNAISKAAVLRPHLLEFILRTALSSVAVSHSILPVLRAEGPSVYEVDLTCHLAKLDRDGQISAGEAQFVAGF